MKNPAARPQGIFRYRNIIIIFVAFHPCAKSTGYSSDFAINCVFTVYGLLFTDYGIYNGLRDFHRSQHMLFRFFFFLIGLALIPFGIGSSYAFIKVLAGVSVITREHYYFLSGFGGYLLVHILLYRPLTMYVFGHELTHAIWTLMFGGKVKSMKVSPQGGKVVVTRSNFLINLSPYFFPIYTFLLFLLYWIFSFWFYMERYFPVFLFLIGFTLAFHLALTLFALRQHQSDIKEVGYVFSLAFVYLVNVLIIILILKLIFPMELKYIEFLGIAWIKTKEIYHALLIAFLKLAGIIKKYFHDKAKNRIVE